MNWIHQHDPVGISDYPDELSFEVHIRDYWTDESGTRIGFFGHAKGIAEFTYRRGDLNFKFGAHRASGQGALLAKDDRALGPICTVRLDRSRQRLVDGKKVTDLRKSLFEGWPLQDIMSEIADFLLIYRDPRFPSPIAIEKIIFPFENR